MLTSCSLNSLFLVSLSHIIFTYAIQQNITVDDASIPSYIPPSGWVQGAACPGCLAHPDSQQAFNGTWHDSTFIPSDEIAKAMEPDFNDSATYIFFILANTIEFADTVTNMNFIIDGSIVGSFMHNPSTSTDFQYNVPVYVDESLTSGQHHMRMEALRNRSSLILFDYLIYTSDVDGTPSLSSLTSDIPSPTTSSPPDNLSSPYNPQRKRSIAPIIGGVVGAVVALLLLAGILTCYWKRRKSDRRKTQPDNIIIQERDGNGASLSMPIPYFNEQPNGTTTTLYHGPNLTNQNGLTSKMKVPADFQDSSHPEGPESLPSSSRRSVPPLPTSTPSAHDTVTLREQVERLMDEVVRLRTIHLEQDRNDNFEMESEAPPGYSDG